MNSQTDARNISRPKPSSLRILLADSDAVKIEQVVSFIEPRFKLSIQVCKQYIDLFPMLRQELPDLLLLGMFDTLNVFEVCQKCRAISSHLPIVLLSRQNSSNESFQYFQRIAIEKGAKDVISFDLLHLDRFLVAYTHQKNSTSSAPKVTVEMMLAATIEITGIGNNFFGQLAQGNYWRKAHASVANEFTTLHNWSADHFGKISVKDEIRQDQVSTEDLQALRKWVYFYIQECERIIVDYRDILRTSNLSPLALQLLPDIVSSE
jgi:CheY-like chemotaxis protein